MKFHIAFVLLAIFGAAQAGKKMEAMTFGSGYTHNPEYGSELSDNTGSFGDDVGSTTAHMLDASTENAEEAKEAYGAKSDVHGSNAAIFMELYREKRQAASEYEKRAHNLAAAANEAYKNSQLHKRTSKDKQAIAKEYEERAQKHDRLSKEQDIKEQDDMRKEAAEHGEYLNSLIRANTAAVHSNTHNELAGMEFSETNECEQHARSLFAKSEEYEKLAHEYKEKSKKEKENGRILEAKGKEEDAKANELENAFTESSKKVNQYKYYELEFLMKGEDERSRAEHAKIRAKCLSELAHYNKDQSEALYRFSNMETKDSRSFHKRSIELFKQTRVLTATATHLMKSHRYTGHEIYSKQAFPHSNYHEA